MKLGVALAVLAGLVAAVYLIWYIGFGAVFAAIGSVGFGGFGILCFYALLLFLPLTGAWFVLLPQARRGRARDYYLARLVRDSIAEISPFSPVGGMLAAARLIMLRGNSLAYASASIAVDATTELMAQIVFLAFGLAIALSPLGHLSSSASLRELMLLVLVLGVPVVVALVFLQRRGARFAQTIAARFFPAATRDTASFAEAVETLYASPARLASSSAFHLLAWVGSGIGTWIGFRLAGAHIGIVAAVALEALLCTIRSLGAFVPAALGVQEAGYAMLAPLFGVPPELGLAVSLLKRAREIVLGVPVLLIWQAMESRHALNRAAAS